MHQEELLDAPGVAFGGNAGPVATI